ncbi:MAG: protein kinase domain-containing protein, partial [Gemmataceae bacterium]
MIVTCPTCHRAPPESTEAIFCMYCGTRLGSSTGHTSPMADPDRTTDLPTMAYIDPEASTTEDHATPRRVGGYRLMRKLGAGGMGTVYEAESSDGQQRVAVKLLSSRLAANPLSVERFRLEGQVASQISHPRCVFVFGADTDNGRPYIVMELMPGTTLKDYVDTHGPLAPNEAVARALDIIDGLLEAHRLGVIHRDVKPSNCFLTSDDRIKVGDFGLSKSLDSSKPDQQLTNTGTFLGTILYASPEQIRGDEVGYESDIYSVAGTIYFMLTGKAPFQHESLTAALARAISEPPPPLRPKNKAISRALERVVLRGLERERNRRWATLEEFRDALAELLPARLAPARPRLRIAAYLVDTMLFSLFIQIPLGILELVSGVNNQLNLGNSMGDPIQFAAWILVFGFIEGLFGTTPGKYLLRLTILREADATVPGLGCGLLRSAAFIALWSGFTIFPPLVFPLGVFGILLGLFCSGASFVAVLSQFRGSQRYRGLHDRLTGTQVF